MVFSSVSLYLIPSCWGPGKVHPGHESSKVMAFVAQTDSSWALAASTSLATSRGTRRADACQATTPANRTERRIIVYVVVVVAAATTTRCDGIGEREMMGFSKDVDCKGRESTGWRKHRIKGRLAMTAGSRSAEAWRQQSAAFHSNPEGVTPAWWPQTKL